MNLEPSHVPTFATTILSLAPTRKYLFLGTPGTYKVFQSERQLTWDLQSIAVWKAAARIHIRGLQGVYNGGLQPETLADGSW
eukprot:1137364-Pelagomonas_calceolata.AAC.5